MIKTDIRVLSGEGTLDQIGVLAKELGFSRTLLVADAGLARAGHLEHAHASLEAAGVEAFEFSDFGPNPDADMLEAGRRYAAGKRIDSIIGLGGGSSLDCAKGINFLLTQGGEIHDFQGYGKATKPMLPMIGVPTTAGTGSEAQSYAIISDPRDAQENGVRRSEGGVSRGDSRSPAHADAAGVGDRRCRVRCDRARGGELRLHEAQSRDRRSCRARRGGCSRRNFERVLAAPDDLDARAAMQLGAFYAGTAIELSMLGATHACANPLTARYGTTHGDAIAILLPHVVRWNAASPQAMYAELLRVGDPRTAPAIRTPPTLCRAARRSWRPPAGCRDAYEMSARPVTI